MTASGWRAFASVVGLFDNAPAPARSSGDSQCAGNRDIPWDEQIVGCTNAIESGRYAGRDLAVIFNNRGNSYLAKADFDRAVADYN